MYHKHFPPLLSSRRVIHCRSLPVYPSVAHSHETLSVYPAVHHYPSTPSLPVSTVLLQFHNTHHCRNSALLYLTLSVYSAVHLYPSTLSIPVSTVLLHFLNTHHCRNSVLLYFTSFKILFTYSAFYIHRSSTTPLQFITKHIYYQYLYLLLSWIFCI